MEKTFPRATHARITREEKIRGVVVSVGRRYTVDVDASFLNSHLIFKACFSFLAERLQAEGTKARTTSCISCGNFSNSRVYQVSAKAATYINPEKREF